MPGTASLVRGEKGRALLIPDLDAILSADLPCRAGGMPPPGYFTADSVSHYLLKSIIETDALLYKLSYRNAQAQQKPR